MPIDVPWFGNGVQLRRAAVQGGEVEIFTVGGIVSLVEPVIFCFELRRAAETAGPASENDMRQHWIAMLVWVRGCASDFIKAGYPK